MFLGQNSQPTAAYLGTDHFTTIIHEMGHSFGLKHGHDGSFHGTLAPQVNDNEFSVMTYASYLGANTATGASEARVGSSPTSYMMYDIAALQAMYGANYGKVSTKAIYTLEQRRPAVHRRPPLRPQYRCHLDQEDLLDGVDAGRHRHLRPQRIHPGPGRRPAARAISEILQRAACRPQQRRRRRHPGLHCAGQRLQRAALQGRPALGRRQPDDRHRQRHADRQRPQQRACAPAPASTSSPLPAATTSCAAAPAPTRSSSAPATASCATPLPT